MMNAVVPFAAVGAALFMVLLLIIQAGSASVHVEIIVRWMMLTRRARYLHYIYRLSPVIHDVPLPSFERQLMVRYSSQVV